MIRRVVICFFMVSGLLVQAQDIHFTMYHAMPMINNPATVGVFNGIARGAVNYRNQWANIGSGFKTYSVMIDGGLLKKKWENGYLGAGLNAFKDVTGKSGLNTNKVSLALSSVVYLDNKNSAAIGLMGSWVQNAFSSTDLIWDSQFDGQAIDRTIIVNEILADGSSSFVDFSAGALWAYGTGGKVASEYNAFKMKAGVAFYHVTRPDLQTNLESLDKLYSKIAFHADATIGISHTRMAFIPRVVGNVQGPSEEFAGGLLLRYMLREESRYTEIFKGASVSFGGYYRYGDAFAPSMELEIGGILLGFAYDFNVSNLRVASDGRGGPEFFVRIINPSPFLQGKTVKTNPRFR